MTVNYKGMDDKFKYRLAEINFNEETEQRLFDEIVQVMLIRGWDLNEITNGYACCEVESIKEYREFVKDYKENKKIRKAMDQVFRLISRTGQKNKTPPAHHRGNTRYRANFIVTVYELQD